MMATANSIRAELDRLVEFIQPLLPFANCHMVDYFNDKFWEKFIPKSIQNEVMNSESIDEIINQFWKLDNKYDSIRKLVDTNKSYLLREPIVTSTSKLIEHLKDTKQFRVDDLETLHIKEFMTAKKCHEVEISSAIINILSTVGFSNGEGKLIIVDAGDGKGYLSSRLALEYNLNVLGIDANLINTLGAAKRSEKLQKIWPALERKAKGDDSNLSTEITNSTNYKMCNQYIDSNTDFPKLVHEYFPSDGHQTVCLSGLHTCGNLASTCLKIFAENDNIMALCNIGCCYNHLNEEFFIDSFKNGNEVLPANDYGFPMSLHLRQQSFYLGRNARNLAAQSMDRVKANNEIPSKTVFYRALLETLLIQSNQKLVQVGRIKKCSDFADYVRRCQKKIPFKLSELHNRPDFLKQIENDYSEAEKYLHIFYKIRLTLAPLLEAVILLDRLLYLKECGINNSFLVQLFDPIISPRCYGIVAFKDVKNQ